MRDAWNMSFREENIPYVNAIIKETLRYYTATPMNLPRKAIKDIDWDRSVADVMSPRSPGSQQELPQPAGYERVISAKTGLITC